MKSLMMTVVAALCCVALAQGPQGGSNRMRGHHGGMHNGMGMGNPILRMVSNPKMAEKLGLTDEQKTKLKELREGQKDSRESQKKMQEAAKKQFELMKAENVDEAAVMAAIDEVFALRKEMAKEQAKRVIAVKKILTPEQIKKAHEEFKTMRESRKGNHGGGHGGPRGKGRRQNDCGKQATQTTGE